MSHRPGYSDGMKNRFLNPKLEAVTKHLTLQELEQFREELGHVVETLRVAGVVRINAQLPANVKGALCVLVATEITAPTVAPESGPLALAPLRQTDRHPPPVVDLEVS